MKKTAFSVFLLLVVVFTLVFASVAMATSQGTIDAILEDAADGTLSGSWSSADVQAALDSLGPADLQYGNVEAVLEAYLAGGTSPDVSSSDTLSYTGADILIALSSGIGLIGGGLFLRRRS